ncbi:glycoside hydrolase family 13 protein [Plicaturopsis crispa FD-325 SS-3]|nr:glycoside hydrolase family 13 protein [Plicaturopsis crispa FD-325 SS-3]
MISPPTFLSLLVLLNLPLSFAATAEQWRGRSIYQIITDRYALPAGADTNSCNPADQTWCGGTWNTITQNLDYIQDAGFTAIWISPVAENYDGPRVKYGDAYHGYWTKDISKLNPRFGTADDLKGLVSALHSRGMYIMVDVVVNNVMSTSVDISSSLSGYFLKDQSQYHKYCTVNWTDITSEQECWLGDPVVPLPDVNTEDQGVQQAYGEWIAQFVQEYNIDGLRIDAAKHVNVEFWPSFAQKAGVFTMGEVLDSDVVLPASYQPSLDSVLHYPAYFALTQGFNIPGPGNLSAIVDIMNRSKQTFKDTSVLGNFLENQDQPRWHNSSVDPASLHNAMVYTFMSDGIPIVYYGQEQSFSGAGDPSNREPLWTSGYAKTDAYNLMATLNQFRNHLVNATDWTTQSAEALTYDAHGLAIMKGDVLSVMTNIGSPPQNLSIAVNTPWDTETATTDILTCTQWVVGSNKSIEVQYSKGGTPVILYPSSKLKNSGICGEAISQQAGVAKASGAHPRWPTLTTASSSQLFLLSGLIFSGFLASFCM